MTIGIRPPNPRGTPIFGVASALVDRLTTLGLALGALSLAGIAAIYCYEVAARYLFNQPTRWGSDVVSYLLCWLIFFVAPALTRKHAHVAITMVTDREELAIGRIFFRCALFLAFVACIAAAYINAGETIRQAQSGVRTLAAVPVQKWWISAPIAFGFALSAWYYAIYFFSPARPDPAGEDAE